jgi:hypothetical protein
MDRIPHAMPPRPPEQRVSSMMVLGTHNRGWLSRFFEPNSDTSTSWLAFHNLRRRCPLHPIRHQQTVPNDSAQQAGCFIPDNRGKTIDRAKRRHEAMNTDDAPKHHDSTRHLARVTPVVCGHIGSNLSTVGLEFARVTHRPCVDAAFAAPARVPTARHNDMARAKRDRFVVHCDVTIDATNRIVDNVAEQLTTRFRASGLIDSQSGSNPLERPTT